MFGVNGANNPNGQTQAANQVSGTTSFLQTVSAFEPLYQQTMQDNYMIAEQILYNELNLPEELADLYNDQLSDIFRQNVRFAEAYDDTVSAAADLVRREGDLYSSMADGAINAAKGTADVANSLASMRDDLPDAAPDSSSDD
ncbi:MAG: hypothetical protein AAF621_02045 [Pseudomonadota bacterium]